MSYVAFMQQKIAVPYPFQIFDLGLWKELLLWDAQSTHLTLQKSGEFLMWMSMVNGLILVNIG